MGIHLITKVRKNMKTKATDFMDRILLRKRAVIKSVNDILKKVCYIEHIKHRWSVDNFISNLVSGLIAYSFLPKKASIKMMNMLPNIS